MQHVCWCTERNDGAGEVKSVLREDMAEERRRLKDEHAAEQDARRQKHAHELLYGLEAVHNGQVTPSPTFMLSSVLPVMLVEYWSYISPSFCALLPLQVGRFADRAGGRRLMRKRYSLKRCVSFTGCARRSRGSGCSSLVC